MQNDIPSLDDQTLYQMKQKHPHGKVTDPEVLLPDIPEEIHTIEFHSIDAESIKRITIKTKGATGHSGRGSWYQISLVTPQTIYVKH